MVHITRIPETGANEIKAFLAITLAHEIAHTLGLKETYNVDNNKNKYGDVGHNSIIQGIIGKPLDYCIMGNYETAESDIYVTYYNDICTGTDSAFCSYCLSKLKDAIPEYPYQASAAEEE